MIHFFRHIFPILLFCIFSVSAQDTVEEFTLADSIVVFGEREKQLPTFNTIAAKIPLSLQQTPASVSVVSQLLVHDQYGVVLGDALRNVSGVNSQTGFGVFDYFTVRGFNSLENGLILTDGTAEPEVSFYNLYNLERLEVLKGPGAFLYGGNALSGTINMVRKQPVFNTFARFSGTYGYFNSYRNVIDAGAADLKRNLAGRLTALWQGSDGYRNDKESRVLAVNPSLAWKINTKSMLYLSAEYVNSEYMPDSGLPLQFDLTTNQLTILPDVDRKNSYQSPLDISDNRQIRVKADFNYKFNHTATLRNKSYFTDMDWLSKGTLLNGAFPTPTGSYSVNRSITSLDDHQQLIGNQLEMLFHLRSGNINHNLLTGLEVSRLTDDFNLEIAPQIPEIDLVNPVETVTEQNVIFSPLQKGETTTTVLAPYLVDQISFSNQLHLFLGGRFDVIDFEDKVSETQRDYRKFSPMGGVTYAPGSNISLYANTGLAFAPPSTQVVGDLRAEESRQFEGGLKLRNSDNTLRATFALYDLKKENIAIPDNNGLTKQIGSQRSRGVEAEASARIPAGFFLIISYAFTDAELTEFSEEVNIGGGSSVVIDRSGNAPVFAPEHLLNFWTSKEFGNGFGVGAGFHYFSNQFIDEDNVFKIDPALVADAALYYRLKGWRFSVNFKNVTGTKYETRGFGNSAVIPANPFAIYGRVEFTLSQESL